LFGSYLGAGYYPYDMLYAGDPTLVSDVPVDDGYVGDPGYAAPVAAVDPQPVAAAPLSNVEAQLAWLGRQYRANHPDEFNGLVQANPYLGQVMSRADATGQ
jgi:hypothetical protein